MMKTKYIKLLTLSAIVVIVLLQVIWTVNVYQLTEKQLKQNVNDLFKTSVNKELMNRMESDTSTDGVIGSVERDTTGVLTSYELMFQEYLSNKSIFVSLNVLDTIFLSEAVKQNIHGAFVINRINPQTGKILETTDPLRRGTLHGAMASEVIPIRVDGSEGVQVLLVSPYRAVFSQMIFVLVLSLLLVLFVGYVFFFLLQSFVKEKQLRQFQTDFSHALIHNMATPLGTIAQINNLMANDKFAADSGKRNRSVDIAQQQILNLQALTDRILTVARSEQSHLVPKFTPVNITGEVRNMVNAYSLQSKKSVDFSTRFHPQEITFIADKTMLVNAMDNLIDNAVKYSGDAVEIEIECKLLEDGLLISIKDNGYGISDKDKRVIFAKFERGEAVTRGEAKGFGLGLAYVKSVAEAHGGTVNLYSKKGEGTKFELFIPFREKITSFSKN